jgi:hypothetical protein
MFFSSVLILYSMSDLFLFSPNTRSHVFFKCPHIILNVRSLSFLPKNKITCFSQVSSYTRSDKERINSVTPFPWKLHHLLMNLLYESTSMTAKFKLWRKKAYTVIDPPWILTLTR